MIYVSLVFSGFLHAVHLVRSVSFTSPLRSWGKKDGCSGAAWALNKTREWCDMHKNTISLVLSLPASEDWMRPASAFWLVAPPLEQHPSQQAAQPPWSQCLQATR